jgi:phosphoserine aminotransferase
MRVYNFSSGPAKLPEEVLQQASEEMLSWYGNAMPLEGVRTLVDFMQDFERRHG